MEDKRQRMLCGRSEGPMGGNDEARRQPDIVPAERKSITSPEYRQKRRCEIHESIDKRRMTSEKRECSEEGLAREKPSYEVKTR